MKLATIGKTLFFSSKIGVGMDPITATQNAITAFFEFLATPAGQKAADRFLEIDQFFHNKLMDLFNKLHHNVAPDAPVPVPAPVTKESQPDPQEHQELPVAGK